MNTKTVPTILFICLVILLLSCVEENQYLSLIRQSFQSASQDSSIVNNGGYTWSKRNETPAVEIPDTNISNVSNKTDDGGTQLTSTPIQLPLQQQQHHGDEGSTTVQTTSTEVTNATEASSQGMIEQMEENDDPTVGTVRVDVGKIITSKENKAVQNMSQIDPINPQHSSSRQQFCPPNSGGLVILNFLGRLGNNFFELAFANIIARELCWDVIYRLSWQGYFFDSNHHSRATTCFPKALQQEPSIIKEEWRDTLSLNETFWTKLTDKSFTYAEEVQTWNQNLQENKRVALALNHLAVDLPGNTISVLVQQIGYPNSTTSNNTERKFAGTDISIKSKRSKIQMLWLNAFFIQYDWMEPYLPKIQDMFTMDPSCCITPVPPQETLVIHIRDHENGLGTYQLGVYKSIIERYGYQQYQIWIVCQSSKRDTALVQELLAAYPRRVQVQPGADEYDALCIMKNAPVLIVSSGSSFSTMAALLSRSTTSIHNNETGVYQLVHYPLSSLNSPSVVIKVPGWKYHLALQPNNVTEFDVDHDRLETRMW